MTHNLLRTPLSRRELARLFSGSAARPHPLPPRGSPLWRAAFANPLLAPLREKLLARADAESGSPLPPLTDALYRDYARTGIRRRFEEVYFERRRRLARAAIALLAAEEKDRRRRSRTFLACLKGVFAEVSWALPAHVSSATGRDRRCIDLFAAETANLFAECLAVFGAVIPAELSRRIRRRLHHDIFLNYRDHAASFWWTTNTSNWNAVCHQGVLGAALTARVEPSLLADLLHTARPLLARYLEGFGPDGACSEGPAYWEYGFGWFSILNEQLEAASGGRLSLFTGLPACRRIARYGPAASLENSYSVNFSDCRPGLLLRPSLLRYLGRRLRLPDCLRQGNENYRLLVGQEADLDAERSDLLYWLRLFLHAPRAATPPSPPAGDAWFPDLEVWIVRGTDAAGHSWAAAAKGGHNAEHHNHNDNGSFLLHVDGEPMLDEIGRADYTRDYFGPQRYDLLATRTRGHSLPLPEGVEQREGKEFRAVVRRAETGAGTVRFEADLAPSYPPEARCRSLVRRVTLRKRKGEFVVDDRIRLREPGTVESGFITTAQARIVSPRVAVLRRGAVSLSLVCGPNSAWSRVERHPHPFSLERTTVSRLALRPLAKASSHRLQVRARLLGSKRKES